MRVIKEKHDDTPKEYLLVCWKCHSELAVTAKDTFAGQYNEPIVKCPVCGSYNDFNKDKMQVIEK